MSALSYATTANLKSRLGITDDDDDTLLESIVDQTNDWVEQFMQRPVGPTSGGTATFDGCEDVSNDGTTLYVRRGIRAITSLTIATSTGATPISATTSDLIIFPRSQNRRPGWPGFEIRFKDVTTGPVARFYYGYGDIVLVGDLGWEAIPPAITEVAEIIALRAWHARQNGQADVVGSDANGEPIVSRYVSGRDKMTLKSYRPYGGLLVA